MSTRFVIFEKVWNTYIITEKKKNFKWNRTDEGEKFKYTSIYSMEIEKETISVK